MTRVLVCGGRDFADAESLVTFLNDFHSKTPISVLIEGGARGADRLARTWAEWMRIRVETYNADWDRYKKSAGPIRNRQMLVEGKPDLVIAFPGGNGTKNMIDQATRAGIKVIKIA